MIERVNVLDRNGDVETAHARHRLAQEVLRVLEEEAGTRNGRQEVVQVQVPLSQIVPFHWLRAQRGPEKVYWSGRGEDGEIAAVGVADLCVQEVPTDFSALRKRLAPVLSTCGPSVRYFGGMRFDPQERPAPAWQAFGGYRFVLPRFELRRRGKDQALVCNLRLPWDYARLDDILAEVEALSFPGPWEHAPMPLLRSREDSPALEGWRHNIEWALEAFAGPTLKKVVFAREASFGFEDAIDPVVLLQQLKPATPECFHFLVQPVEGVAFVGASPELLFSRQGRLVESEAVAGTRPRGVSATDDARLREELLQSDKERREHEYVRISIQETLGSLCETFHIDTDPSEMKLARGRHLVSHVRGMLREGVTSLDVLQALHPTPAVGGYPAGEAIEAIRACEHFDRGWYAGPVGWIGPDAAEFAVGIRTGLVHDRRLSLYSGAGIVPGSTPDAEWKEIEHKISDFINVLGLDLQRAKY